MLSKITGPLVLIAAVVAVGYSVSELKLFLEPCAEPVEYHVGTVDPRYGISNAELAADLAQVAALWNAAAGKTVVTFASDGEVAVNLEYTEEQATSELGQVIDQEQADYDAAQEQFEASVDKLDAAKNTYERLEASFNVKADMYENDVAYWNERGGAPPAEYEKLQAMQRQLDKEQTALNSQAAKVNAVIDDMNRNVDVLNAKARAINSRVDVYNANAHTDFDQGRYIEDEKGKRITIREFTEETELKRVLTHELGHAIGLDHVENPDSVMYSYNVGEELILTEEDIAELRKVCKLD